MNAIATFSVNEKKKVKKKTMTAPSYGGGEGLLFTKRENINRAKDIRESTE